MFDSLIATSLNIPVKQVSNTVKLLADGATVPFISRYRKEATGSLDEVQIQSVLDAYNSFSDLQKRKDFIVSVITSQNKLSPELKQTIDNCWSSVALEDLYLPYKVKRHSKAEVARLNGLEPLAKRLMLQLPDNLHSLVSHYINEKVKTAEEAVSGAQNIIAEWVNEHNGARNRMRSIFSCEAVISSKVVKGKEKEAEKFSDYFDYSESLKKCSSHRLLALRRGESLGLLKISISPEDDAECLESINHLFVKGNSETSKIVQTAVADGYKRLLRPSIESEFASSSKKAADVEAIRVFSDNLHQLLLAPPLGQKRVLALDPGFRTGCKAVCLDAQGNLLHFEAIFPNAPQCQTEKAGAAVVAMVAKYQIQAISIGNGTASRETETFVRSLLFDREVQIFVVSENGASVYSASPIARDEFPNQDVTVRGAVSIGRRLIDPLAELVKIDPKSIGVGQYQHDVDQNLLKKSLSQTVLSCVNQVGVDVNTASSYLLTYISGLGPKLAQNIVDYRMENGPFHSRKDLLKVHLLGNKAFEQCAGFLRVSGSANPLDNSAVHPESYPIVEHMAADLHCSVAELISHAELRKKIIAGIYVNSTIGLPTVTDILSELEKPGRDPRKQLEAFSFSNEVHAVSDLVEGMILPGIVTNITDFGAFVDIGVHQDGLIHISQMANHFISSPSSVVTLHQHLSVKVLSVDSVRNRISLSLLGVK